MLAFRVSVCLTHFFNDERSYCYIYLDKETYGTIAAFERYLRRQFRLPDPFCLMTGNHLLPSDQSTNVISYGDVLTVIPLKKDWRLGGEVILIEKNNESENNNTDVVDNADNAGGERTSKKKKKKKGKPENAEVSTSQEDETTPLKIEKPDSPENDIDSESEKKTYSDMDVSIGNDNDGGKDIEQQLGDDNDDENNETDEQNNESETRSQEPQRLAEVQSAIQQLKLKALSLLNDVASQKQVAGVSSGRINKRKRIRKRNKNTSLSVSTPDLTDAAATQPITFKPVKQSVSHIRFENDQPKVVKDNVRDSEITTKPRIIHAIENNTISTSRRTSVCGTPEPKNVGPCNPSVYPALNTIVNGNSKTQERKEQMITIANVKNRLREFPVMDNVLPVVKDLVLFKMLKLAPDYTPTLSDYILGRVLEVDKPNGIVNVSIVDGHEECIPAMQETDSTGELIIDVSWGRVTEPRLIFP